MFQASRFWISQRSGVVKLLWFNDFLFVVFSGKKQPIEVRKMPEIWKNQLRSDDDISKKIRQNAQILKSPSRNFWWRLGLEVFTRSQSRRLRSRLYHCLPIRESISMFRFPSVVNTTPNYLNFSTCCSALLLHCSIHFLVSRET